MTWDMAAIAGMDPLPLTFAELRHAYQVKCDFEWNRTAALMALTANLQRERRARAFKPSDFYQPQLSHRRKRVMDLDGLKALFTRPA